MPAAILVHKIKSLVKDIQSVRIIRLKLMAPELLSAFSDGHVGCVKLFYGCASHVLNGMSILIEMLCYHRVLSSERRALIRHGVLVSCRVVVLDVVPVAILSFL